MFSTMAIAFSLSTDAFAASVSKGAALHKPRWTDALRTGLVFGSVEAATPFLGWLIGLLASSYVAAVNHWIAFILLGVLGLKMAWSGLTRPAGTLLPHGHSVRMLVLTAIGTSMDAMAVGMTLALVDASIVVMALATGLATCLMTTTGLMIGRMAGERFGRAAEVLGGLVLVAVGTSILASHLGLFDRIAGPLL